MRTEQEAAAPMPYTWKIDPERQLVEVTGFGPMDLDETLSAPFRMSEDPLFEPGFGVIVDLREIQNPSPPDPEHVLAIGRNLAALRDRLRGRIAVVVPDGLATAAELSTAIAGAKGFEALVFSDPDEARAWVQDAPEPEPRPA